MALIFVEDFETDGNPARYTTSNVEFTDGSGDFFLRTDGSDIGSFYNVAMPSGSFYFAVMDTDGEPEGGVNLSLDFTGIDISGFSNIMVSGLFAEDDDGSNQDWDDDTSVQVQVQVDGGGYTTLFAFEAKGGTNSEPRLDTDLDGVGDGTALTDTFAEFGAALGMTGSTLDIRILFDNLDAGDEDISLDAITVTGDAAGPVVVLDEGFDYAEESATAAFTLTDEMGNPEVFFHDGGFDYLGIRDFDGDGGEDFGGDTTNGNFNTYTNVDDNHLVGSDINGEGLDNPAFLTWSNLDITGLSNLLFSADLATDDTPGASGLDPSDFVKFEYRVDGGAWQNLMAFETLDDSTFNVPTFLRDTDFDGIGDGASLTSAFQTFTQGFEVSGSSLDLRLGIEVESGFEDIGIDNISIVESQGAQISIAATDAVKPEGDGGTTPFVFTLTRDDTDGTLTVDFDVTGDVDADDFAPGVPWMAPLDEGGLPPVALPSGQVVFADGSETATLTLDVAGDTEIEDDETFTVTISNASSGTIVGATANGTIQNDDLNEVFIHEIQGTTDQNLLDGEIVTVTAVVVGDFQDGDADDSRNLSGFFLQEELEDEDGNPLTSEGIFVFDQSFGVDVQVGDLVQVTGRVDEFFGETQIEAVSMVTIVEGGFLPDVDVLAKEISLPAMGTSLSQEGDVQPDLEAFEGMLVTFPQTLQITEQFQLDRFNEIKLVQGERPEQFTQNNAPDQAGFAAHLEEIGARTITYDDGLNVQNALIDNLDGFAPYTTATAPRMGDTIDGLTGVLDYKWAGNSASQATWRVRSKEDGDNSFDSVNERPENPDDVFGGSVNAGQISVASFNVLNFFTTIDNGSRTTDNGLEPRGADDLTRFAPDNSDPANNDPNAEFNRQLDKLVDAIVRMDADVFGLVELENSATDAALSFLTDAVNDALGVERFSFVSTGLTGSDAITTGFMYDMTAVQTIGMTAVLEDPSFLDPNDSGEDRNRPAVAQSFLDLESGESFTAVVNHFKSKGDSGLDDDPSASPTDDDMQDGQGFWNDTRAKAAQALADWLATDPTGTGDTNIMLLGDYNAYAMEDPITTLEAAGYTDLAELFLGDDAYSFVFDGQIGTLDYAFANNALLSNVVGVTEWHINADEADALDYNLDFGRSDAYYDASTAARNSDHDPVIVGLDFNVAPEAADDFATTTEDLAIQVAVLGNDTDGDFDMLTVTGLDVSGLQGTASLGGGTVAYDPGGAFETLSAGTSATETFTYTISDGLGRTDTATVTIGLLGVNDAPIARDDVFTTGEDTGTDVLIGLLDNDSDVDADDLLTIVALDASGTQGDVALSEGQVLYTANGSFESLLEGETAIDTFTYTISDRNGGTSSATVTVTVEGASDGQIIEPVAPAPGEFDQDVIGTPADEELRGDRGSNDFVDGGAGDDLLRGQTGDDVVFGGAGDDELHGGKDDDLLFGQSGDDFLIGGRGNDLLLGGDGDDLLEGRKDDDILVGGAGNDVLSGNMGDDLFVFGADDGNDVITKFKVGEDAIGFTETGLGFDDLTITQTGDTAIIEYAGGTIFVETVKGGPLTSGDFLFELDPDFSL